MTIFVIRTKNKAFFLPLSLPDTYSTQARKKIRDLRKEIMITSPALKEYLKIFCICILNCVVQNWSSNFSS